LKTLIHEVALDHALFVLLFDALHAGSAAMDGFPSNAPVFRLPSRILQRFKHLLQEDFSVSASSRTSVNCQNLHLASILLLDSRPDELAVQAACAQACTASSNGTLKSCSRLPPVRIDRCLQALFRFCRPSFRGEFTIPIGCCHFSVHQKITPSDERALGAH
jgi:hypothetical protein